LVARQAKGHSMVRCSENGCLGVMGFIFSVQRLGKSNSRPWLRYFFSLQSPFSLFFFLHAQWWHDVYAQSWHSI
jgi:hypothetical protein